MKVKSSDLVLFKVNSFIDLVLNVLCLHFDAKTSIKMPMTHSTRLRQKKTKKTMILTFPGLTDFEMLIILLLDWKDTGSEIFRTKHFMLPC